MTFQLNQCNIIGFIPIVDVDRARAFYRDTLGLRHVADELPYALVFESNGIMIRLAVVKERPNFPGTILGWQVSDAIAAVKALTASDIQFERFGFMQQDELGIWSPTPAHKVAWFKDPDGNLLSVSEHPK